MPRPGVGNPKNKGGGRKPAAKEKKELEYLLTMWHDPKKVAALLKRYEKGQAVSLQELYVIRAYVSDKTGRIICSIADKIVPSKLDDEALKQIPTSSIQIFLPQKHAPDNRNTTS